MKKKKERNSLTKVDLKIIKKIQKKKLVQQKK